MRSGVRLGPKTSAGNRPPLPASRPRTTSIPTAHLVSWLRSWIERHGQTRLSRGNVEGHPARTDRSLPTEDLFEGSGGPFGYRGVACRWQRIVSGSQHGHGGCHCIGLQPQGQNSDRASRRATEPASRPTNAKRSSAGTKNVRRKPSAATSIPTAHHQHPDRAPPASRPRTSSASRPRTSSAGSDPGSSATDKRDLAAVTLKVTRPERIGRYRPKICLRARVDRLVTVASLAVGSES